MFRPIHIFPAHLEDFIAVSVIGCGQQDLTSFGDASEAVFGVVAVDGGFSFCLFFDQVSVIVVNIFDLIACFGVFLGDYLIVFVIRYCDGSFVSAFGDGHSASCCVVGIGGCAEGSVCVFGVAA